jgi:hypothetical protein
MTINGQPEAGPHVRASNWWTSSIQLVASCLKRSLAGHSSNLCRPSLKMFCPYSGAFSGETERFPSSIDSSASLDRGKEAGDESPKALFLERMY